MEPQQIIDIAEKLSEKYVPSEWATGTLRFAGLTSDIPIPVSRPSGHEGGTRSVFLADGVVFKAVRNSRDAYLNAAEWDLYSILPEWAQSSYCKPLYISTNQRVIVMERITNEYESGDEIVGIQSLIESFKEKIGEREARLIFQDTCSFNFGLKNGQIQFLDYAAFLFELDGSAGFTQLNDVNYWRPMLREALPNLLTSDI